MHIIDVSYQAAKKYILDVRTYASYAAYIPMAAGNTGLEDTLAYIKKEWITYDRE